MAERGEPAVGRLPRPPAAPATRGCPSRASFPTHEGNSRANTRALSPSTRCAHQEDGAAGDPCAARARFLELAGRSRSSADGACPRGESRPPEARCGARRSLYCPHLRRISRTVSFSGRAARISEDGCHHLWRDSVPVLWPILPFVHHSGWRHSRHAIVRALVRPLGRQPSRKQTVAMARFWLPALGSCDISRLL